MLLYVNVIAMNLSKLQYKAKGLDPVKNQVVEVLCFSVTE